MDNQPELVKRPRGTCADCFFSVQGPLDPGTLKRQRYCKFFPPSGTLLLTQQGPIPAAVSPPVREEDWCWQWRENSNEKDSETAPKLLSSN